MRYAAAVKGGLHANYSANIASIGVSPTKDYLSRYASQALAKKGSFALRELVDALIGSAPGSQARYRYAEISASPELGGKRPINTENFLIDRPTTAADVTMSELILTELSTLTHTVEQATNLDRNPLGTR